MSAITEIPRGTNDLVRCLVYNSVWMGTFGSAILIAFAITGQSASILTLE